MGHEKHYRQPKRELDPIEATRRRLFPDTITYKIEPPVDTPEMCQEYEQIAERIAAVSSIKKGTPRDGD